MSRGATFFRWGWYLTVALLLAFNLGVAGPAWAQATTGTISGTVADEQGGVLPGVTLTARNTETGVVRTDVSDGDGSYRFTALPPGTYELKAELPGFAVVEVKGIEVQVGSQMRQSLKLALQGVSEMLTVTAQAPVVETTKTEVSTVVTQQQINSLPIADRQPVLLTLLLPGTSQDGVRPRRVNASIGSGTTYYGNTFLVDGAMTTALKAGEPRQDFPQAAIREFKVNVSQSNAEFGGNTGGIVSIVTKSGTNSFSGEAFEYFRDKSLNRMDRFEQERHDQEGEPKPDFGRNTYGVSLGGPIVKDRLHFFVAGERTYQRQNITVKTGKPQFYSSVEGTFPSNYLNWMVFARGDLQLTPQQSFFARYGYMGRFVDCEGCGGTNSAFSSTASNLPADQMVMGHTWVLSSKALSEIRFQGPAHLWQHSAPPGYPVWKTPGAYPPERYEGKTSTYNFPSLTWGSSSSQIFLSQYWELRGDITINGSWKGEHSVKTGGAYLRINGTDDTGAMGLGTWTIGTDQYFNPSNPASFANLTNITRFTNSIPGIIRKFKPAWVQVYVQDEWRPRSNVTLNLGLRYDLPINNFNEDLDLSIFPKPIPYIDLAARGDTNNVGPRTGLAWDVRGDGKSVVRAGYGRYYRNTRQTVAATERSNLLTTSITIANPRYPDPYQGRDPYQFASTAPQNIVIWANDARNPSADTLNAGLSQELASELALHLDGVYTNMTGLEVSVNINTPDPVTRLRPLPAWGQISQRQTVGKMKYRAFMARLEKRFSRRNQFLLSYTLMTSDEAGGGEGSITDFFNPGPDDGPGATDRRHTIVASGSVLLPFDVTLGAVWTLRTTMPFSAVAGVDLNSDGSQTDYVPGTSRNQGNRNLDLGLVNAWRATRGLGPIDESQIDGNRYKRLDMRVSKAISLGGDRRVELIGQVFNVLSTDNLGGIGSSWVTNALSDSFGRILTVQPRAQAELAIRFVW